MLALRFHDDPHWVERGRHLAVLGKHQLQVLLLRSRYRPLRRSSEAPGSDSEASQDKGEIHLGRSRGEAPVLVPHVVRPRKGSTPASVLAQQPFLVRFNREQDSPESFPPIVTPSDVSVAIFEEPIQWRPVDLRIRR